MLGTMLGEWWEWCLLDVWEYQCRVGVGGVLLFGSFSMCPTVECILCSENVSTAHCMKQ